MVQVIIFAERPDDLNPEQRLDQPQQAAAEAQRRVGHGKADAVLVRRGDGLMLKVLVRFLEVAAVVSLLVWVGEAELHGGADHALARWARDVFVPRERAR